MARKSCDMSASSTIEVSSTYVEFQNDKLDAFDHAGKVLGECCWAMRWRVYNGESKPIGAAIPITGDLLKWRLSEVFTVQNPQKRWSLAYMSCAREDTKGFFTEMSPLQHTNLGPSAHLRTRPPGKSARPFIMVASEKTASLSKELTGGTVQNAKTSETPACLFRCLGAGTVGNRHSLGTAMIHKIMNTEQQIHTPAELSEMFRQAAENALASKEDTELALIIGAIRTNLELARRAVRAVGIAGYHKHLEAAGFQCHVSRLKRGLVSTGIWRSKHHKAKVKSIPAP
jgi:hypothetical protein